MQKEAWTYTMAGTVLGAIGCLLRWLQCEIIFDEVTGLPEKNAAVSFLMILFLAAMTAGLWWLTGRMSVQPDPVEPENAMSETPRAAKMLLVLASVIVGAGAAYMFLTESTVFMRMAALLGLLSAPLPALYPSLSRWGGFGAFLTLFPVIFFAAWLVGFYKEHAVNPVVWEYGIQILAVAAGLFAAYRVSGCMFYRLDMHRTAFACVMAMAGGLIVLMDRASAAARVLLIGWGLGFGVICWVLLRSVPTKKE